MARLSWPVVFALSGASATLVPQQASERQIVLRQGIPASESTVASSGGSLSSDGRFVAFVSMGERLPSDTSRTADVYVMDRETSSLTLETPALQRSSRHGSSGHPRLSGDGNYLVFESDSADLVPGPDTNNTLDVFVRDRLLRTTTRVSGAATDGAGNHRSEAPAISDNGEMLAFESRATNLVAGPDANGTLRDVYLVRLGTGTVIRASVGSDGRQRSEGESYAASLSGDGRFLAFASSGDLSAEPGRREPALRHSAIYVRDTATGDTSCASCVGGLGEGRAGDPQLSADGRFVVFAWQPDRGRQADTPRTDIVLHDRIAATTTVITSRADASSRRPRMSANGRYLAFESLASNLACHTRHCPLGSEDENLLPDIYVFDRSSGQFRRLSGGADEWWVPSVGVWLDRDGSLVSFSSRQPLGGNDPTTDYDLFVRSLTSPRQPSSGLSSEVQGSQRPSVWQ